MIEPTSTTPGSQSVTIREWEAFQKAQANESILRQRMLEEARDALEKLVNAHFQAAQLALTLAREEHVEFHKAIKEETQQLREAWRADAMQWRENHHSSHHEHVNAHEREHQLNQQAIDKAEKSVDRAVLAARDSMEKTMTALSDRLSHAEDEFRRQIDNVDDGIGKINLLIVSLQEVMAGNAKAIQGLNEALTWVVRIVITVIILSVLALIFKPGVTI